jgi:hypothetical protein
MPTGYRLDPNIQMKTEDERAGRLTGIESWWQKKRLWALRYPTVGRAFLTYNHTILWLNVKSGLTSPKVLRYV